jgi:CheY-like chemotaxis protein
MRRSYKVISAGSIAEARTLAAAHSFNFVLADIGLPDGNGYDLMAELQKIGPIKGIALTGYGMEKDVERSRAAGFVTHLTKPVTIQSLETALKVAVNPKVAV